MFTHKISDSQLTRYVFICWSRNCSRSRLEHSFHATIMHKMPIIRWKEKSQLWKTRFTSHSFLLINIPTISTIELKEKLCWSLCILLDSIPNINMFVILGITSRPQRNYANFESADNNLLLMILYLEFHSHTRSYKVAFAQVNIKNYLC